ncbi:DUF202 domain-containing protein [Acidithiobacillus thiooxidans]|uniref:DUF202 domain-containing protein n=1 Tax=Acidithiobacillus thiooxidans TaxID=930 RepID=UPI0029C56464|nr:DUF202 domain-containing protein [Acidithiobacillus thiooxidans]MDX5935636.1 DUF202 domain-containing protein [Acidithiobacillus thiooxidans]
MQRHPYDDYARGKMVLRDWLAMDRTMFAATRTFNDYLKIFMTAIIATLVFLVIFKGSFWDVVLYVGFMVAAILLAAGIFLIAQAYFHHRNLHHDG